MGLDYLSCGFRVGSRDGLLHPRFFGGTHRLLPQLKNNHSDRQDYAQQYGRENQGNYLPLALRAFERPVTLEQVLNHGRFLRSE
jgi:hypothetical protein